MKNGKITTQDRKQVWVRFIEGCVKAGVDITDYIFDKPTLKDLRLDWIVEQTMKYETLSDEELFDQWKEDNDELVAIKEQYTKDENEAKKNRRGASA